MSSQEPAVVVTSGQLSCAAHDPPLTQCPPDVARELASVEGVTAVDLSYNAICDGFSLRRLLPRRHSLLSLVLDNNQLTSEAMAEAVGLASLEVHEDAEGQRQEQVTDALKVAAGEASIKEEEETPSEDSLEKSSPVEDKKEVLAPEGSTAGAMEPQFDVRIDEAAVEKLLSSEGGAGASSLKRTTPSFFGRLFSAGSSSSTDSPSEADTAATVDCDDDPRHLGALPPLVLGQLQTLTVNNNAIEDIHLFVASVALLCPGITYLSMLKNKACRDPLTGGDAEDYKRSRLFVLYHLPNLRFLDSTPVSAAERSEANRVGQFQALGRIRTSRQTLAAGPADGRPEEDAGLGGNALPETSESDTTREGRARFGVSRYVYYGKHSEGNRFITNEEL